MFLRSALPAVAFTLLTIFAPVGCAPQRPPEPGTALVRSEQLDDPHGDGMIKAPIDGKYACYKEGLSDPLETFALAKGDRLGFEIRQSDQGQGRTIPILFGVAAKERFVLPMGDKYVWKRL